MKRRAEQTELGRFRQLAKKLVAVPKQEVDRQRKKKRAKKT